MTVVCIWQDHSLTDNRTEVGSYLKTERVLYHLPFVILPPACPLMGLHWKLSRLTALGLINPVMDVIKTGLGNLSCSRSLPAGLQHGSTALIWIPAEGFHTGKNDFSSYAPLVEVMVNIYIEHQRICNEMQRWRNGTWEVYMVAITQYNSMNGKSLTFSNCVATATLCPTMTMWSHSRSHLGWLPNSIQCHTVSFSGPVSVDSFKHYAPLKNRFLVKAVPPQ